MVYSYLWQDRIEEKVYRYKKVFILPRIGV